MDYFIAAVKAVCPRSIARHDAVQVNAVGAVGRADAVEAQIGDAIWQCWDGEPKRSSLDHDSVHDEP
jgi:hypothetical protein